MRRPAGLLAGTALALSATHALAADPQPDVLAAWSQVFGVSNIDEAEGLIAPTVEMRFLLVPGQDCNAFGIEYRLGSDGAWTSVDKEDRARDRTQDVPSPPLAVTVCTAPMRTGGRDWFDARLTWDGEAALLTSELVEGDTARTVGHAFVAGPANGRAVRLWGGASIGARNASGGEAALVVVALGDTGCRGVPQGWEKPQLTNADRARLKRTTQPCDAASWPLAALAAEAMRAATDGASPPAGPDLVLHLGDYRYFLEDEVPHPDNRWLYWQKDFLPAAQPLLLAGPLLAVRGNHEACGDWGFGDGYFQLFGQGTVTSCAGAPDPMPPRAFDVAPGGLAGAGADAHRFVVLDTNDDTADGLRAAYGAAMSLTRAPGAPESAWWITHVPAVALVDYGDPEQSHTGDPDLQADLIEAAGGDLPGWLCGGGACRPSQILMGHQHLYQSLAFPEGSEPGGPWTLPRHVIAGHGGVRLDPDSPAPAGLVRCRHAFDALAPPGGPAPVAVVETETRHGALVWRRSAATLDLPAGWTEEPIWIGELPAVSDDDAVPACVP